MGMKNLKYLYIDDSVLTSLSSLEKLKEIHVLNYVCIPDLFEQKQEYSRTDLKIYAQGMLVNGLDDAALNYSFSAKRKKKIK